MMDRPATLHAKSFHLALTSPLALTLALLAGGCFAHRTSDTTSDAGPEEAGPPTGCGAPGACEPGEERLNPEGCVRTYKVELCNDACEWELLHECGKGCGSGDDLEPTYWDEERVCIYQGTTLRHCRTDVETIESCFDENDELRVGDALFFESTFMMDKYPATYRRYAECVADGACEDLTSLEEGKPGHILEIELENAVSLCDWAGGRLPTVHESLRAARGDGTELPVWPWGDNSTICEGETHLPISACFPGESRLVNVPADEFPQSASPFGVQGQAGIRFFWTADHYYSGNLEASELLLVDYELLQDPDEAYKLYTALVGSELYNAHEVDQVLYIGAYKSTPAATSVFCVYDLVSVGLVEDH